MSMFPVRTTNGLRQSSIAARHEYVLERIQGELKTSTSQQLQARYHVGSATVANWENYYSAKVLKWCQSHKDWVPGELMKRGVKGQKLHRCVDCYALAPFQTEPEVRDVELNMPATPGRLNYWAQPNGYTHSGVGQEVLAVSSQSEAA